MQLSGVKILIIFSEERGEKKSHALLPMEKMTIFASGQKVVKYESSNRGTKVRNCRHAASWLCKKKDICAAIGKDKSVLSRELKRNTVSHERIYQFIREDKRAGGSLWKHCGHDPQSFLFVHSDLLPFGKRYSSKSVCRGTEVFLPF